MTSPRLSQLAARVIAREGDLPVETCDPVRRGEGIAAVEGALRARARRRILGRAIAVLAVAASVAAVAAVRNHSERAVAQNAGGATGAPKPAPPSTSIEAHPWGAGATISAATAPAASTLADDGAVHAGDRVATSAGGGARLDVPGGTELVLDERTSLGVLQAGPIEVFALTGGAIDAHVAKLRAGERFVVRTPDAEVEVRGTRFRVSVVRPDASCGADTVTRVVVREGVVAVRRAGEETLVEAGASWPPVCPAEGQRRRPTPPVPSSPPSTLGGQNALFARAKLAEQRGAVDEALDDLERLRSAFPNGPLAETAAVERMRLLRSVDPRRAAGAAQEYLRRYPSGFARTEAEAIAGTP